MRQGVGTSLFFQFEHSVRSLETIRGCLHMDPPQKNLNKSGSFSRKNLPLDTQKLSLREG